VAPVDANRRFARLAVAWYAIDADRVAKILRAAQVRQERGEDADLLDMLVRAELLTEEQAQSLRIGQAPTRFDEVEEGASNRTGLAATAFGAPPMIEGAMLNGEPGQVGPYRILRRLGQGGMGAVFLAFDSAANRQVAVKVLSAELAQKHNVLRRFQLEGQHGALLRHPNIVQSYDAGFDENSGLHYIVLEFVDGISAHELLDRHGMLDVGDAVHIVLDIARALEHAHKNQVIHRDIKPANILLASSGLAKLSDLGLAKRLDDANNLTHATQGIGTPYYMPYEQAMNAKMADERSDIYSLGATLFHLLTGDVPFTGVTSLEIVEKKAIGTFPPAKSLNPRVPMALDAILARMLKRDPADRYQTVSDVIVDLDRTRLAAAMPSYASIDTALQDPVMRQRLTSPIEATRPDMRVAPAPQKKAAQEPTWLVRYRDSNGNLCKAKATMAEIIDRLRVGTIPIEAEAARIDQKRFRSLAKWPEFAQVLANLQASAKADASSSDAAPIWWWIAAGTLGVIVVGVLATAMVAMLASRG
jgi:serine/threonine-protein kinase